MGADRQATGNPAPEEPENHADKQAQDAFIVAATRTPIGKAPRACSARCPTTCWCARCGALAQVPTLTRRPSGRDRRLQLSPKPSRA